MSEAAVITNLRSSTIMGRTGHTTLAWTEADDEKMVPLMQRLLDSGYLIWVVTREFPLQRDQVRTVEQIGAARRVQIDMDDFETAFVDGTVAIAADDTAELERQHATTDAREAARSDTVVQRPRAAG